MSDLLIVFANSDDWLKRKKGKHFMPQTERLEILSAIECVDIAMPILPSEDADDTACEVLRKVRRMYPDAEISFVNGGDRSAKNTPESIVANKLALSMVYGAGEKIASSSDFLTNWCDNKTSRQWGFYNVIYSNINENIKVKVLEVNPGKAISLQLHEHRAEHWVVVQGTGKVILDNTCHPVGLHEHIFVTKGSKHKLENIGKNVLRIVEVQYGDYLEEDDIKRFD